MKLPIITGFFDYEPDRSITVPVMTKANGLVLMDIVGPDDVTVLRDDEHGKAASISFDEDEIVAMRAHPWNGTYTYVDYDYPPYVAGYSNAPTRQKSAQRPLPVINEDAMSVQEAADLTLRPDRDLEPSPTIYLKWSDAKQLIEAGRRATLAQTEIYARAKSGRGQMIDGLAASKQTLPWARHDDPKTMLPQDARLPYKRRVQLAKVALDHDVHDYCLVNGDRTSFDTKHKEDLDRPPTISKSISQGYTTATFVKHNIVQHHYNETEIEYMNAVRQVTTLPSQDIPDLITIARDVNGQRLIERGSLTNENAPTVLLRELTPTCHRPNGYVAIPLEDDKGNAFEVLAPYEPTKENANYVRLVRDPQNGSRIAYGRQDDDIYVYVPQERTDAFPEAADGTTSVTMDVGNDVTLIRRKVSMTTLERMHSRIAEKGLTDELIAQSAKDSVPHYSTEAAEFFAKRMVRSRHTADLVRKAFPDDVEAQNRAHNDLDTSATEDIEIARQQALERRADEAYRTASQQALDRRDDVIAEAQKTIARALKQIEEAEQEYDRQMKEADAIYDRIRSGDLTREELAKPLSARLNERRAPDKNPEMP